jgi:hypothetical protein
MLTKFSRSFATSLSFCRSARNRHCAGRTTSPCFPFEPTRGPWPLPPILISSQRARNRSVNRSAGPPTNLPLSTTLPFPFRAACSARSFPPRSGDRSGTLRRSFFFSCLAYLWRLFRRPHPSPHLGPGQPDACLVGR